VGGVLSTADGLISVSMPAGAYTDTVTITLAYVDPVQQTGNLKVGTNVLLLTALDSMANSVTSFSQPLVISVVLTPDDLAALANGNLDVLAIMVLNPDTGVFDPLPTTLDASGVLSGSLDRLAPVAAGGLLTAPPSAANEAPPPPVDNAEPVIDDTTGAIE
jgi:hypothetical protein